MNIFVHYKEVFLRCLKNIPIDKKIKNKITVEIPKNKIFGDISFNAPLILSSILNRSSLDIAKEFKDLIIKNNNDFEKIEIAKPGFINFTFKKKNYFKFFKKYT